MSTTTPLATIFGITLNQDFSFSVIFHPLAIGLICGAFLLIVFARWLIWKATPKFELDSAEIGIGNNKLSFKPNLKDQEVAYKIWVELSTRKIGLEIDLEHDVISEIYDSWHNFFSITRDLIKDIPVSKVKNRGTREIIKLSVDVLNEGLRPHLTKWQARFRHWYERQIQSATGDIDPQSIQKSYSQYSALEKDLLEVNRKLMIYRELMRKLVLGQKVDRKDLRKKPKNSPAL